MPKIITIKNVHDLGEIMNNVKESAENSEHKYDYERICIVGQDAIDIVVPKFGLKQLKLTDTRLTDATSDGKVVPLYHCQYYYDARDGGCGFSDEYIKSGVVVNDLVLEAVFYNRCTTAIFYILHDMRTYHEKISNAWKEQHPEPNKVGKLSDKKAMEWYEYLTARREEYDRVKNNEDNEIAQFLDSVRAIAPLCKESRIGDKQGALRANNLVFSYSISKGYIHKEIKVDYRGSNTLKTFQKMIKGEF